MCLPGDHGCDNGSMILHADAVDYNEKTHQIDAHGDVRIEPYRSQPPSAVISSLNYVQPVNLTGVAIRP
jgi:hypothetical protein